METFAIEEIVTVVKEAPIPFYCSHDFTHWYKVFSPSQCIQVTYSTLRPSIGIHGSNLAVSGGYTPCSAEEFDEKFEKVLQIITSKK